MPKIKTNRGAAKRFKVTKKGKVKFQKAFKRHLLEHKDNKMKRQATRPGYIHPSDEAKVRQLLPYHF